MEKRTANLLKANKQLKLEITERMEAEQKLKESEHSLKEQVKELTCLYGISEIGEIPNVSIEEIIQGTIDLIPPAWQFPNLTCAKISFDNIEYKTENFKETKWKLSLSQNVIEKLMEIEIYYLKEKPFLEEEGHLINDIGIRLKGILEKKEAEKSK